MSDPAQSNKLYDAAVGFMVAEKSHSNAWSQVAEFVDEFVRTANAADDVFKLLKKQFAVVEKQVRADFQVGRLPAAWRSAKSTALNAALAGIPIMKDGAALPKTDVSKVLKATKMGILIPPRTPKERCEQHFLAMADIYATLTPADRTPIAKLVGDWYTGVFVTAAVPVVTAAASSS